jgi:peptidoglycan hydrolase-like protein with peptidoglycan-binding domain
MALQSKLFKGDPRLEACQVSDPAHLTLGAQGGHVAKVQSALFAIDSLRIDRRELLSQKYGPSTAQAVLAYKSKRQIINHAYQNTPDNIVGKLTIARLDRDILLWEQTHKSVNDCRRGLTAAPSDAGQPSRLPGAGASFALTSAGNPAGVGGPSGGQPKINKKMLVVHCSITRNAALEDGYPLAASVELAKDRLFEFGMNLSLAFGPASGARFADTIDFPDRIILDEHVALLRKASEDVRPGFPSILRAIVCRRSPNGNPGETFRDVEVGGSRFPPFVLLNSESLTLDHETLLHEMIHAALPKAVSRLHDLERFSVFFEFGRTQLGDTNRSVLKPERAAALSNGFFAI